jgi:hypothetical protein
MPNVILTHAVGNMETWLAGGADRAGGFKAFCTGHRVYRLADQAKVALVLENVDMAKLGALMQQPDVAAMAAKHTVIQPVEMFVEIEGAR